MFEISDRLKLIANNINTNESVCDIGTDHGYLGIYLKEINPNREIILTDYSFNSLNKGIENTKKYSSEKFIFRCGYGLEVLEENEVDTIVIAGMGGLLISEILSKDLNKCHSFNKFILQPRNHSKELRCFLLNNGFNISKDLLVREGKFICEVLIVHNSMLSQNFLNDISLEIPHSLINNDIDLLKDYLNRKILNKKNIINSIKKSSSDFTMELNKTLKELTYIEDFLNEIK